MKILEKLNFIVEKTRGTNIPTGLLGWVADYIEALMTGNIKLAKNMKKNIEKEIKENNLNKNEVFMFFGDPDDPKQKETIKKNIENHRKQSNIEWVK